ncbi:thiol peroxidase [Shewanella yunxiaonensis]|uniref:Thiol peroxidase n=1 Tax=Shewanella yunxiaonensis TaxID=2829809 RepID=A0ABX7YV75_9GAMM|nr:MULTISPECIES: thiol peroxidase [Shewanella]MDF0532807.1 thiol peroxidase [Shewanella sp. A32]QUN06690.1 thiol peroxidase [Shewanella yunxiaonensis]
MYKYAALFALALTASSMSLQAAEVTMGGKPVSLLGKLPQLGQVAPSFRVVDDKFQAVSLSDFKGKTVLISAVPSLDTGVCALQTKRFNTEVANFDPSSVVMLSISEDLPFAQKRFCKVENVESIKVLSDSVWRDFGEKYGLIIKDMGILARSIFIIDPQGKLQYVELVPEIGHHPDYDKALAALTEISKQS